MRRRSRQVKTTWSHHHYFKYANLTIGKKVTAPNRLWVSDITYILLGLFLLLMFSCIHEESTETTTIVENFSGQQITITPYNDGVAITSAIHTIEPSKKKVVQRSSARGKGNSFPYSDELQFMDSVIVDFSPDVRATHYSYSVVGNNSKAIRRDDPRSLLNRDSYKREILSEAKYGLADEFTYTFTVQDYLNATK